MQTFIRVNLTCFVAIFFLEFSIVQYMQQRSLTGDEPLMLQSDGQSQKPWANKPPSTDKYDISHQIPRLKTVQHSVILRKNTRLLLGDVTKTEGMSHEQQHSYLS